MLQSEILKHPTTVLTDEQRHQFFSEGYLLLDSYVEGSIVDALSGAMADLIETSKEITESNETYKLEQGHSRAAPRLHRITSPQDHHPLFWEFFCSPLIVDLASDLVGPDVKFHHAKLNVKSERGTAGFAWHQDIAGWPHTDFSAVTIGVYLTDCTAEQGALNIVTGSQVGPIYPMFDDANNRIPIPESAIDAFGKIRIAAGRAGSVVVLNCRVIHGSGINQTSNPRPLLLPVYTSADSYPYTKNPIPSDKAGEIVRGQFRRFASMDTRPCPVPPDYGKIGYQGPWSAKSAALET